VVANDVINGSSNVLDVTAGDTSHGDTAVTEHVNVVLLNHLLGLFWGETSEGEHTNLVGDMLPSARGLEPGELIEENLTHVLDTHGHVEKLIPPLLVELRGAEHGLDNVSSVLRWVGVEVADDDVELGHDVLDGVWGATGEGEGSDTLSVESKVLGERLRNRTREESV